MLLPCIVAWNLLGYDAKTCDATNKRIKRVLWAREQVDTVCKDNEFLLPLSNLHAQYLATVAKVSSSECKYLNKVRHMTVRVDYSKY